MVALLIWSIPALAQDIVVTAARAEQGAGDTGQAVTIITREEIERRQTVVISDLLATTPGVTVSRNGGIGGFTGVRIRGAEAEQTLVLIDGVRVNDPSAPAGGFDFASLLAGNIERIEVLRGPSSVPWGSQAIGGVVNIVTRRPGEGPALAASAEYGHADSVNAVANANFVAGPIAASLGGGWFRTDGISQAAIGSERDGYERYGANGRIEIDLARDIAVDLRGYYSRGRTGLDGFPDFTTFDDTAEYSISRELSGYAGLNARFGPLANRVAFTVSDIDRANLGSDFPFAANGRVERFEYQGDLAVTDALRAVFGAETERSRFGDGFERFSTGIDSAYAQLIAKPVAPLTLTGGIRHDRHEEFGGETTLGANAALDLGATLFRASYAEGFKAPTLFQLKSGFGNPALEPETARSIDLGIERRLLGDRIVASVTGFRRTTRNQIDFIFPAPAPAERPFGTYANIARTRAAGVEIALDLKPVDTVAVTAAYSYVDAENRSPDSANIGNALARRPKHSVSVSADYAPAEGLSFGGTVLHVSDSFDDAANSIPLDGYALVSLRAAWAFDPRFELYGRVENLLDADYRTVATYGTIGRAAHVGVRVKI